VLYYWATCPASGSFYAAVFLGSCMLYPVWALGTSQHLVLRSRSGRSTAHTLRCGFPSFSPELCPASTSDTFFQRISDFHSLTSVKHVLLCLALGAPFTFWGSRFHKIQCSREALQVTQWFKYNWWHHSPEGYVTRLSPNNKIKPQKCVK
jgi:hypothetical protein